MSRINLFILIQKYRMSQIRYSLIFLFLLNISFVQLQSITSVTQLSENEVNITWNEDEVKNASRYRIRISNDNFIRHDVEWPAQTEYVSIGSQETLESFKANSNFDCYLTCVKKASCVAANMIAPDDDPIWGSICYLKSSINNRTETILPNWETFNLKNYATHAILRNLSYGFTYEFKVSLYNNSWSQFSMPSIQIDLKISKLINY
jgi:hypothetical protein